MKQYILAASIAAVTSLSVSATSADIAAPLADPDIVRDEAGLTEYVIFLSDIASARDVLSAPIDEVLSEFQKPEVRALVHDLESDFQVRATHMTSHALNSFTAFLTNEQLTTLAKDKRVRAIYENRFETFSGVWNDTMSASGEVYTWGRNAMIPSNSAASLGLAQVYVVDSGVGFYGTSQFAPELNIVQRVNGVQPSNTFMPALVGCYPHSAAVSGVIGAYRNNSLVVGMDPGVPIVSVSTLDPGTNNANIVQQVDDQNVSVSCNAGFQGNLLPTDAGLISALDWVYLDILSGQRIGIVNLSTNGPSTNSSNSVGQVITTLSTKTSSYKGALVVQSAGNASSTNKDACSVSYEIVNAPGVIVVGAIDSWGWPSEEKNGGLTEDAGTGADGSLYGSTAGGCVQVWAPGEKIVALWPTTSTWLYKHRDTDVQDSSITYATTAHVSGTSLAAPYVTGLAAYLYDNAPATSPLALKNAVLATLYDLGSSDQYASGFIRMPSIQSPKLTASPTNSTP